MSGNAPYNTAPDMNPNMWGPHVWATIHTLALKADADQEIGPYSDFVDSLLFLLPCGTCRHEYSKWYGANHGPLVNEAFAWSVRLHNFVNSKLGHKTFSLEEARAQWTSDKCSYKCSGPIAGPLTGARLSGASRNSSTDKYYLILLVLLIILIVFLYKRR